MDEAEVREVVERLLQENLVQRATTRNSHQHNDGFGHTEAIALIDPIRDYLGCRGKGSLQTWHIGLLTDSQIICVNWSRDHPTEEDYWQTSCINFMHHLKGGGGWSAVGPNTLPCLEAISFEPPGYGEIGYRDIESCLDADSMQSFATACKHGALPGLKSLCFIRNQIGDPGSKVFSDAISDGAFPKLETIHFGGTFSREALYAFATACSSSKALPMLKTLDLADDDDDYEVGNALAATIRGGALPALEALCVGSMCSIELVAACTAREIDCIDYRSPEDREFEMPASEVEAEFARLEWQQGKLIRRPSPGKGRSSMSLEDLVSRGGTVLSGADLDDEW